MYVYSEYSVLVKKYSYCEYSVLVKKYSSYE
jgi:hypothetical protein